MLSNIPTLMLRRLDVLASGASCAGLRLARSVATGAANAEGDLPKPTYTYQSPGSSISDPAYKTGHSLGSPSYVEYDPKPRTASADPLPQQSFGQQTKKAPTFASTAAAINAAQKAATGEQASAQPGGQPQYVYMPPGSSMREASYGFSAKDPVYFVDPPPGEETTFTTTFTKSSSSTTTVTKQQPVAQQPPQGKVRMGLKDDYANTSYVTSPNHSMEEPHYVSISDPLDKKPKRK